MEFIIDRFEGDFAIIELEDKSFEKIPKKLLPVDTVEGSIIKITLDKKNSEEKITEISNLLDSLFK